jgi:hypothetical protein
MKPRKIPRGTFVVGGLAAVALATPVLSAGLYGLTSRLGWGLRQPGLEEILVITLIFAGLPALLTGGGVARFVAHRIAESPASALGGAMARGAVTFAVAGVGLALLAAMPLAVLPLHVERWWPLGVLGVVAGAITGAGMTVLVALRARRHRDEELTAES